MNNENAWIESFEAAGRRHLKRPLKASDGYSEETVRRAEQRLGLSLPKALRDYYAYLGRNQTLSRMHNVLLPPHKLTSEDGYIVFMLEAQFVVSWAIRSDQADDDDPVVWQIVNCVPREVYSEELRFSDFIVRMLDWQAGVGAAH
ncbi:MAG: hypothetical protein ACRD1R_17570 [Acidobacteriota bacterium]